MNHWLKFVVCLLVSGQILTSVASSAPLPDPPPDHWYRNIVGIDFVRPYAILPQRDDAVLIDARDERRFDAGHMPGAINLPAKRLDELAPRLLPGDKNKLIIFYCDGIECKLSHMAADDTEDLGFTNIRVYAGGFPEWFRQGNVIVIGARHLKTLIAAGEIGMLLDVRDKAAYDSGHLPAAISLPAEQFEQQAAAMLPADKTTPLLFYCSDADFRLSHAAARKASALGYRRVMLLDGGYPAWRRGVP